MTGRRIQELRHALGENAETFGKRFAASGRTVENWEQDRRRPSPLVLRMLESLAKRQAGKDEG
jgi:DNA-binding transcriptional regulator YiaG